MGEHFAQIYDRCGWPRVALPVQNVLHLEAYGCAGALPDIYPIPID